MKTSTSAYALRLPISIKAAAEKLAAEEGISLNQFVATAVAEKVAALQTASFFSERKGRADWAAFDKIMRREAGEPPQEGDEIEGIASVVLRTTNAMPSITWQDQNHWPKRRM